MRAICSACCIWAAVKLETLEMGALLHGHDVNEIIAELEKLAET